MDETTPKTTKEIREELEKSEEKYKGLVEKRNELNQKARLTRDERDMLNEEKKKLTNQMKKAKKTRDDIVLKMRNHKQKRLELQKQAKELIKKKKEQRGKYKGNSLFLKVEELKIEIRRLQYEQETVPMNVKE